MKTNRAKHTEVTSSSKTGNEAKRSDHTPTPWHRNVSPAYKYPIYADKNGDPNGRDWIHIAAVLSGNPNQEADLDFIVRAVNGHEALLRLVKRHREWIKRQGALTAEDRDWARIADRIIEQAEGKGR
jgi:hypothetical protein